MHKASLVNALGADFFVMGTKRTQVKSTKPVFAVCAVRTGSGKSQNDRKVAQILMEMGYKVVLLPPPYAVLAIRSSKKVQRFATYADRINTNAPL